MFRGLQMFGGASRDVSLRFVWFAFDGARSVALWLEA